MFDQIAAHYDMTNDVLTLGQVRVWRAAMVSALEITPGKRILDVACGTGTSTAAYARAGADVTGVDFSEGMLSVARTRHTGLDFRQGDATALDFPTHSFDAVTVSYGLRNIENPAKALREMRRVTRPGGSLVIAEFSTPTFALFRALYHFYLESVLPRVARRTSSDPEGYYYLTESILAWPDQDTLARRIQEAGWRRVSYRNLFNGIMAIHRAVNPGTMGAL